MQGILSVLALLMFLVFLALKALSLHRKGIRAIVFAETNKSDFLLLVVFLALFYSVLASIFGLPIPEALSQPFWTCSAVGWLGLLFSALALAGFARTLVAFGNSFRIGIDEKKPDELVTDGMFAVSRNPVYVCFLLFFAGLFLTNPNFALAFPLALLALAIHRQILREEAFLEAHYGQEYLDYKKRVRRYF